MNAAEYLAEVAAAFQKVGIAAVFVGGATIPLYLDPVGADAARATEDIDCIVNCVLAADYADVEEKLRAAGFTDCLDEDAPTCRRVFRTSAQVAVLVDVMPLGDFLGFQNRYYEGAVASAEELHVGEMSIRVPTPGFALATKIVAWLGRGNNDPMNSKDFEDIVALADGCKRLLASTAALPPAARHEVGVEVARLLARQDIRALVQSMVPQPPSAARVTNCLAVLEAIASTRPEPDDE